MLNFGNKEFRNLQEQVLKNAQDIESLKNRPLLEIQIVEELPEEGIGGVLYLVPAEDGEEGNLYEEYVWIEGEWEQVGSTEIDLSNYPTLTGDNEFSGENTFSDTTHFADIETQGISPTTGSTYDIGADGKYFKEAKVNKYTVSASGYGLEKDGSDLRINTGADIKIKSSAGDSANVCIYPYSDGKGTLGKSNIRFSNVNTSGVSNDYSALAVKGKGGVSITCDNESSVRPSQNDQLYLGSDGSRWKRIYVGANGIDFGNNAWIQKDGSNRLAFTFAGNTVLKIGAVQGQSYIKSSLSPDQESDNIDLGRSAQRWNNIYVKGNLSDGTYSVAVADIATKPDYANPNVFASGTLDLNGEDTIDISAQGVGMPEDGLYMFTYGNAQCFIALTSTMIQNASAYPMRCPCPVLYSGSGYTGNLKITRTADVLTIKVAAAGIGNANGQDGWKLIRVM